MKKATITQIRADLKARGIQLVNRPFTLNGSDAYKVVFQNGSERTLTKAALQMEHAMGAL